MKNHFQRIMGCGAVSFAPKQSTTKTGHKICNVKIGIEREWRVGAGKKDAGQIKTFKTFLTIACWRNLADVAMTFNQGDDVVFSGTLESNSWDDQNGERQYSLEVRADSIGVAPAHHLGAAAGPVAAPPANTDPDDEIPF